MILDVGSPEYKADPYPLFARLRRESPVARLEPFGFYAVSRYEDVLNILRNPGVFSSAGMFSVFPVIPGWSRFLKKALSSDPIRRSIRI